MKLWKSKKPKSCVPGKSGLSKNDEKFENNGASTASSISGDRAMSPAQSEDSGLAPDRGSTYATISLPRENAQSMGIVFADRPDINYPPTIGSINALGPAADFLTPGDRIHQINGISTIGLASQHIMSMLCHGDGPAIVEIEYSLPEYVSQSSLCVTSKLAQVTVERENGCLGLTLRGGGDYPLIVTNIRPNGPVFKTGRIKPGDRLLRVDNLSLINKTLSEAQQILKNGHLTGYANLIIEYDVSVMHGIEFSAGPLLIEIERPINDNLGIVLSNYSSIHQNDDTNIDDVAPAKVFIASILPASIADRCGALAVGDQILSVDETLIENSALSPDEVMVLLDTNTDRGYTQLQIMPAHTQRGLTMGGAKYGFGTFEASRAHDKKLIRKSCLPIDKSTLHSNLGICRTETVQIVLDCSHGSGITLGSQTNCGQGITVAAIVQDSVADRSGCIQKGDRILAVNKMYNLDINTIRTLLGDLGPRSTFQTGNWVELEIEFDMADSVIPSSGVFNVKLVKVGKAGLGITVNGSNHGAYIVTEVKPGSPAHRTGSLRSGDILLAVDSHPLQNFNVDALLKENKNELTTLTVKRNCLPDFLFDGRHRSNHIYGNCGGSEHNIYGYASQYSDVCYGENSSFKSSTLQPDYLQSNDLTHISNQAVHIRNPYSSCSIKKNIPGRSLCPENTQSLTTEVPEGESYHDFSPYELEIPNQKFMTLDSPDFPPPMECKSYGNSKVFTIQLETNGGPLGITLAGSEDMRRPIIISGLTEGGIAQKSGELKIGDCLLAINEECVQGMPLSHATKLLQSFNHIVDLKILRHTEDAEAQHSNDVTAVNYSTQPQAVYAKIQRRPRSSSMSDAISSTSTDSRHRIFYVTLFKDKVYDDYGFSVSDGLYEKGVFINRIRSGGPADLSGLMQPYDRIMQVNETKTQDFDCCLTVPLIAAAGDKIEIVIQRTIHE